MIHSYNPCNASLIHPWWGCRMTRPTRAPPRRLSQAQAGRSGNAPARMADIGAAAADAHRAAADARSAAAESARCCCGTVLHACYRVGSHISFT